MKLAGKPNLTVQNKSFENRLPAQCRFSDHGCTVELMKNDLDTHEKECLYRLVKCVDLACHEKVPFIKLLDHMSNDHEREDFVNAEGSSYKSHFIVHDEDFAREIMWISDHLMLDGRHFFRECCRNADGLWFIWVYLLGSSKEAENYQYSIKINSEDKEEELAYKGKVLSLDVSKEKLASLGVGLVFPDVTAKHFWAKGKIHYSVVVSSKKSASKSKSSKGESSNNVPKENAKCSKKEKATSTEQTKQLPVSSSPSTQSLTLSASGALAKPEASIAANSEDVKETPC